MTLKPAAFLYAAPRTVKETLALLAEHGSDAKLLAGGQSLMPLINMRLVRPAVLIDLNPVRALDYIKGENGTIRIGALTRQRTAERSPVVAARVPLLAEALRWVGHPQIRNRGTIGGSLAHADPAAELPAVAAALDATFIVARQGRGKTTQRVLSSHEFFVSYLATALEPTELLTEVRLPALWRDGGWAFVEVSRRHGDFALVGAAAILRLDGEQRCHDVRLVFTGVGPTPVRIPEAEAFVDGRKLDEGVLTEIWRLVADRLQPESDIHASADYRRRVGGALARRALLMAASRARGVS
jgi:aerobic carbon-monoxide dehydrogenase medium subunit